jgi:hypothetical protein
MLKHRIKLQMWVAAMFMLLSAWPAMGQSIYGALTGVVSDPSQAQVPNAKITLKNKLSGDIRRSVTNSDGFFSFVSVPVGTYEVTVEASGFKTNKSNDVTLEGAQKRNLDIVLQIGATSETVEVSGASDTIVPVDSGEKSSTLNQKQLQDFSVVGRSAAEFIKIMPGMSISGTGTENRSNFTGETIGINGNGEGGSQSALNGAFSANGSQSNSIEITADGAHVSDPGCNCATPVNPNTDMIQEFKVLSSNFSAENSKGPVVISSIAKAGGTEFHGGAYLYARHYAMNANDSRNNRLGLSRPNNKYFFPGGNIGGPVLIPGTNFNKNRDKWFFFTGFEFYQQTIDTGVLAATVPTAGMRNGDFSDAEVAKMEGLVNGSRITAAGGPAQQINKTQFPGGIIPSNQFSAMRGVMNLYPLPNANPTASRGFNYVDQLVFNQNSLQSMSRLDYNLSDRTKIYGRFNYQRETQVFPVGLWWRNANQVPYPTEVDGRNRSYSSTVSMTHTFNSTTTNEFVFGYTKIEFPNVFRDPAKVDRAQVGAGGFTGLWKNGTAQIPAATGWGGEFATMLNPGGFEAGGARGLFADKWLPTFSNNFSKVIGTHTMKFGGFYERIRNSQPANRYTNGLGIYTNWGNNTSGSAYGDMLLGRPTQYEEASFNRLNDIRYNMADFFVQDDWKVNRRLTLNLGLRASYMQPWQDGLGFGFTVLDRANFNPSAPPTAYSGFTWNGRDKSVPNGGYKTRPFYYQPRVGVAYDLMGDGSTVLRGGWGRFYYHMAQFTTGLEISAGVRQRLLNSGDFNGGLSLGLIGTLGQSAGDALSVGAVDRTTSRTPYQDSYSVTIARRLPFSSLLEVSYVGNRSRDVAYGAPANLVPANALASVGGDPNQVAIDTLRPIRGFQNVSVATFGGVINYNSLQASWIRTKGRYNLNFNYTYGKQLGTISTGNVQSAGTLVDPYNIENNYGVMPSDRRHLFNAAYSVEMGNLFKGNNAFAKGILNGWQLSGISQIQSGVNLAGASGYGYNLNLNGLRARNGVLSTPANDPTESFFAITNRTIWGSPELPLRPAITCDPGSGLGDKQFLNGNCFAIPFDRRNVSIASPAVYGPMFMNHDLGMFKNFDFSESRRIQLRFNAYNFLNQKLDSFINGTPNLNLNYDGNRGSSTLGRMTNPIYGRVTDQQGRRIVQVAIKFFF